MRRSYAMKGYVCVALLIGLLMISCTANRGPSQITRDSQPTTENPVTTSASSPTQISTLPLNVLNDDRWNIYDPDPQHLWNRLFRHLFGRMTSTGSEYGRDSVDPLLWPDTTYLLEGPSYQRAIQLLDEFLSSNGEDLITDPLKRAFFQQDMWAVFDWLTFGYGYAQDHPTQRKELEGRIAQVIQKVALSKNEILALPEDYTAALRSRSFPAEFQDSPPLAPFLPADLYLPNRGWLCIGRQGGPIAMTHTEAFPFLGRSVFLVYIRVPGGKEATLSLLRAMRTQPSPELPDGAEVALVRRALLIDQNGEIVLSPLVLSVQVRHFKTARDQFFYQFQTNRSLLFAGMLGGFQPVDKEIELFQTAGDVFQFDCVNQPGCILEQKIPSLCTNCHIEGFQGITGIRSILSYSRDRFSLPNNEKPILVETTPQLEAKTVISWKQKHQT